MWKKTFNIGNKEISENSQTFIIAEAGVNHNGSVELAKKLIDVAARAGADAIKFQTFVTEELVTPRAKSAAYQQKNVGKSSQFELIKQLELTMDDFEELARHARKKDILFLSTPFDLKSAEFLSSVINVPAFKIASGEITNLLLIKQVARYHRPIILSTGMATLGEIESALKWIRQEGEDRVVVLHCVSSYPTPLEQANLRVINTLRSAFNVLVGYSDHTLGITAPLVAVALGAKVIEKHFTLDKDLPGPDHGASLNPDELMSMIREIRSVERALGDGEKRLMPVEVENKKVSRKSIVARHDLKAGTVLTEDEVALKRPEGGLSPKFLPLILGKPLAVDVKKDEFIQWTHLKWENKDDAEEEQG